MRSLETQGSGIIALLPSPQVPRGWVRPTTRTQHAPGDKATCRELLQDKIAAGTQKITGEIFHDTPHWQ